MTLQEKTDRVIAVLVTILFGVFVIYQTIYNDSSNIERQPTEQIVSIEQIDNFQRAALNQVEAEASARDFEDKKAKSTKPYQINYRSIDIDLPSSQMSRSVVQQADSAYRIASPRSDIEVVIDTLTTKDSSSIMTKGDPDTLFAIVEDTAAMEALVQENPALKGISEEQPFQCGIIVGSYAYPSNQQRKIDRLKEAGYQSFGYMEKGLHIAAVRLDCDTKLLREELRKIKMHFSSSAFVITKQE